MSVIYRYLTQYTDFGVDQENLKDKATSIVNIAKVMKVFGMDESEYEGFRNIAKLVIALADLIESASDNMSPEKTVKLAYTVSPDSNAKVVATSANKKLVKVAVKNGVIEIKATKASKKKRGTIVAVTVKSGNETKTINVEIKNRAKKLSAKRKSLSVKKGQTVKVTFKVDKAQNSKKAVTNLYTKKAKIAAKIKKIAVVKRVKVKKGKIVVTIVAKKKGTAKLKLKLSEKVKASAKIVVK